MHSAPPPRIPQIKRGPLSWLRPLLTLAVLVVSLLHAWELVEDSLRSLRRRDGPES